MAQISGGWQQALRGEFSQPYYAQLYKTVRHEYQTCKVFPPPDEMFNAFHFTPLEEVRVVILGQDPYHGDGQANGLCFSVKPGIQIPPSLVNIAKSCRMTAAVIYRTTDVWKNGPGRVSCC